MEDKLILVDKKDKQIGTEFKLKTHKEGRLHRAFSIFVFNEKGELLLQKRSSKKYHSGGLWTNTCCSHPKPGEETTSSAHRRLQEEMGFDCNISEIFSFVYKAKLDHCLTEHEFDHIFIGKFNQDPIINKQEAEDFKWATQKFLTQDIKNNPKTYTYWFQKIYKKVFQKILSETRINC
jgi:isopentenyl-diphosphate delta-isomerase